jgi:hypothetical protein
VYVFLVSSSLELMTTFYFILAAEDRSSFSKACGPVSVLTRDYVHMERGI